ncbi:hypothetical protein L1987_41815 [Smallanthus sonchifolius]|uniref:Uncharacterized protein n=1 Tax=Smallanthus sonchifolius TaxID=185202 RepID=A0ACB9GV53_9ASTR|nr:hypothetical protein L1987_41815 [Smallanthus sonchifolius]
MVANKEAHTSRVPRSQPDHLSPGEQTVILNVAGIRDSNDSYTLKFNPPFQITRLKPIYQMKKVGTTMDQGNKSLELQMLVRFIIQLYGLECGEEKAQLSDTSFL